MDLAQGIAEIAVSDLGLGRLKHTQDEPKYEH